MSENRYPAANQMTEDDYRKYIKVMVDEITDIKDLRQLYIIAHVKFINRVDIGGGISQLVESRNVLIRLRLPYLKCQWKTWRILFIMSWARLNSYTG
ncbi:hypothetical protein [Robinsoniella peoriensis]|uniref:hypothetical protein n=1 Tax=Robinsoniella peoriensis TaxID=180332 RepID=UPI003643EF81